VQYDDIEEILQLSQIIICDIKLEKFHTVKDLGVTFDEQLKFSDHYYDKIKQSIQC